MTKNRNTVNNFSYPPSAAAVVFGGHLSAQAAFWLHFKSPATGNFSYQHLFAAI